MLVSMLLRRGIFLFPFDTQSGIHKYYHTSHDSLLATVMVLLLVGYL